VYILAVVLTTCHFELYGLLRNSYKSNLRLFIYKNAQTFKVPTFAYMCISFSVASTKISHIYFS
jgi:hypothetical protein